MYDTFWDTQKKAAKNECRHVSGGGVTGNPLDPPSLSNSTP